MALIEQERAAPQRRRRGDLAGQLGLSLLVHGVFAALVGVAFAVGAVVLALTGHGDQTISVLAGAPATIGAVWAVKVSTTNSLKLDEHGIDLHELRNGGVAEAVRAGNVSLERAIRDALEMPTDLRAVLPAPPSTGTPL